MIRPQAQLEHLELLARQVVEGFIIGLHKSPFHGFSVEFAEHRLYNPGDPLRHIDWRVYGRTEKLFVKRFEEETNLRCCIAIDTSSSMHFPKEADKLNKLQFATLSAACLLQLLKRQLDAAALALFEDQLYSLSACRSTSAHYRLLVSELERLLTYTPEHRKSDQAGALHQIAEQMHKRSLVVVFSDLMPAEGDEQSSDLSEESERLFSALQHLRFNKHEVILFHITEGQQEQSLIFENRPYEFVDLETGEKVKLRPQQVREEYVSRMASFQEMVANRCHQYGIDRVVVDLSQPVEQVLYSFLVKRNKLL